MKKTLESGAELDVTLSSFSVCNKLKNVVVQELESIKFDIGDGKIENLFESEFGPEAVNTFKNLICRIISSEKIEEAIWPCMDRATYKGVKITRETFENEDARQDYLPVFKEVLWLNLRPFFKSLNSLFSMFQQNITGSPK